MVNQRVRVIAKSDLEKIWNGKEVSCSAFSLFNCEIKKDHRRC